MQLQKHTSLGALVCLCIVLIIVGCQSEPEKNRRPNVLFLCIDDLRPELGCYGHEEVQSPHIDALAAGGQLFTHHYVTVPTCGASRFGLLTGRLPRHTDQLSNQVIARQLATQPEGEIPETFIHQLRRSGYHTVGIGKISHSADGYVYGYEEPVSNQRELPHSWDELLFDHGKWGTGWNAFFAYADGSNRQSRQKQIKPYEAAEVSDTGYPDGLTAQLAIQKLQEVARDTQPFFMGVGFFKPHLPFNAPRKYWDLYDTADITISPVPDLPDQVNRASLHGSGEFNQYALGEEKASLDSTVSPGYARHLRHAYLASVSYTDAQVGKVLKALEDLGLSENTIVVLWGDHGWHLGDHRVWGKHTIFEQAVRSALIIKAPGLSPGTIDRVVSTVDIYPTLMQLCNTPVEHPLDGTSLLSLMQSDANQSWDDRAFSYFRKGISLRTPRYRYTRYFRDEEPVVELYDHRADPYEGENVATSKPEVADSLFVVWKHGQTGIYEPHASIE